MSKLTGNIFSIERYAIHDGPGIRTQVFFKGCPLRCLWCSNPEGRSFKPNLMYTKSLCIHCGSCVETCRDRALSMTEQGLKIDRDICTLCGDCVHGCYADALEIDSFKITAEALVDEVERDTIFYETSGNGGITLCGGEPLAQPAFALELLSLCKERGIHTAIETCGHYPFAALEQAIPYLDFVYYDIKHMNAEAHEECTAANNELILGNLQRLQAFDVDICVRVPVIPTLNDSVENMEAIASFVKGLPRVKSVELLPYHKLGANKNEKLGLEYPIPEIPSPEAEDMQKLRAIFDKYGITCVAQV